MKSVNAHGRGPVFFCYLAPAGFSGQKEATEMVLRGLRERGWDCRRLPQPVLDRNRGGVLAYMRFAAGLLVAWLRALQVFFAPGGILCVNIGQTKVAFLRDVVPLLWGRLAFGRDRVIVSLHGSLFMQWSGTSDNARLFRGLLRLAGTVTVLGERQKARLAALGVEPERVEIVVNSCPLAPIGAAALPAKFAGLIAGTEPLRMLHLSSLIATKGFPEYLQALADFARVTRRPVEAVLCGKVTASEFQERFPDNHAAESWIGEMIARINRSTGVRVRWVRGAVGAEKEKLFREAHLFVLPTRYAVEAQPIVLLEAMASGCAVISTGVGEIPTILDRETAFLLEHGTPEELVAAFGRMATDPALAARFASNGWRRFAERYELARHLDGWEARLRARLPAEPAGEQVLSKS